MLLFILQSFAYSQAETPGQNGTKIQNNNMRTLIVYFSYTAGNTKGIAEKIHKAIGGDIVALEPQTPYSSDYDSVVNQAQEDVRKQLKPALKPLGVSLSDYDRIIIGTPTWWYKMAPVVLSFLTSNDFSGKTVVPFMTNAGWPGSVIKDMTAIAKKNGAKVENAHEFKFSSNEAHYEQMITPEEELNRWIESLR